MQTLQIDGKKAKTLFKKAAPEFQEMLKDTFGESFFSEKITDRVKTYEDACEALGITSNLFGNRDTPDEIAYKKLKVIALALNEGWQPDWTNSSEYKYYPYFRMPDAGYGFACILYLTWFTITVAGSRLCFKTAVLAEYAGKQFLAEYEAFMC